MVVSAPRARDDGSLPPCFDGSCPPYGHGRNVFPPCPHCNKQNHLANKCWKQFDKPPTAQAVLTPPAPFSLAPPNIPAPQYHVTLVSAEYDALRRSVSIDASSFASLASLSTPSTSGTSALLASSSLSWIIDSGASAHMIGLRCSYHHITLPPPIPPLPLPMADLVTSFFSFSSPNPLCS